MKAREIVGKRIVALRQSKVDASGGADWAVDEIELDDGSLLRFMTLEDPHGGDYSVKALYLPPDRKVGLAKPVPYCGRPVPQPYCCCVECAAAKARA